MDTITESFKNIYAHFPFCEAKCHYCDFFSLPEGQIQAPERARIYGAILRELESFQGVIQKPLETVFLGGGTPSLVPLEVMGEFVAKLPLDPHTEVTMEANPSSITTDRAKAWRRFGINRISMGVQALNDDRLAWLGRVHSKTAAYTALDALFEAGFENVSIDYIVGVPDQSRESIEREIEEVLTRFPHIRHISAYLLTLKQANSRFRELPSDDEQLLHLQTISRVLANYGFEQYEISNFARPNSRARHNENYWLGGGYLGIGPSAHSYWPTKRQRTKNWASLGKYTDLVLGQKSAVEWDETLTGDQERVEYLMLRLRRSEGLDFEEYRQMFGRDLYQERRNWIDLYEKKRLCRLGSRLQLTADGFFLSDQIVSNIL